MKKITSVLALSLLMMNASAQKANIQSALNYLKDNDVANAKKMMDEATMHESTKENAKVWLLKAVIYQAIATPKEMMPQLIGSVNGSPVIIDVTNANSLLASTPTAYATSVEAFSKSMSLNAKYEKAEVAPLVQNMVYVGFNKGIALMNESKFMDAAASFNELGSFGSMDNGKLFKGDLSMDTIFANAKMYRANSIYQSGKEDEAMTLLQECLQNPITQNVDLYIMTTDLLEKKGDETKWMDAMKAAKAKYPSDKRLLNNEINYYLKTGKGEQTIAKLKEGIAADPTKVDLYIILGQTYANMANPIVDGKLMPKPSNAKELEENAVKNYLKASELDPTNAFPQFYVGSLYFNQAKEFIDGMNKEKDDAKYEKMKPTRNAALEKAIPFLEKSKSLIEKKGVNEENKETYGQVLIGLAQSYNLLEKAEKLAEIKKLQAGLK